MSPNDSNPTDTNSVTYHPDYIEVVWHGAQNAEKVRATNNEVLVAAKKLQAEGKPFLASLTILNHPAMPNMSAFSEVLKIFQAIPFDRLAICGDLPSTMMPLITTVIGTFNRQMEIKYLKTPEEGLAWLKSNEKGSRYA